MERLHNTGLLNKDPYSYVLLNLDTISTAFPIYRYESGSWFFLVGELVVWNLDKDPYLDVRPDRDPLKKKNTSSDPKHG